MLANMNILIVGKNDRLRDYIEALGAETCIAPSYEIALAALRVYTLHCAILLGSLTPFEGETLSALLTSVDFPHIWVDGASNDARLTREADSKLLSWLGEVWHKHEPHEFEWVGHLSSELIRN